MDMAAQLSQLRRDIPGCHVAVFVDLSARMALAQDTRSKAPQERLDGLADRAKQLLTAPGVPECAQAVAVSEHNLEVFLRADLTSDDTLALVCGMDVDLDAACQQGLALLKGVVTDA